MNKKGQGALEYLLLIGGALIVAAIVLTILPGLATKGGEGAETAVTAAQCAPLNETQCTDVVMGDFDKDGTIDCDWVTAADDSSSCMPAAPAT